MKYVCIALTLFSSLINAFGQSKKEYSLSVENPSKLIIELIELNNELEIIGTNANTITVSCDAESLSKKPNGAKELQPLAFNYDNTGLGLSIVQEGNRIAFALGDLAAQKFKYQLHVPKSINLKIDYMRSEASGISIKDIQGEIEAANYNKFVKMENVKGPVVINSNFADIRVSFSNNPSDLPCSFISRSGDIDISLPKDASKTIRLNSTSSATRLFSELELKRLNGSVALTNQSLAAELNGGGSLIRIQTFSGNIFLRYKK